MAMSWLGSSDKTTRIQGVRRLAAQNDFSAIQLLLGAIAQNAGIVSEPEVKLEAVRALAPFAARDASRRLLASWATDDPSRLRAPSGMVTLAQSEAAMALAAAQDTRALDQLVAIVMQGGDAGTRAASAILAHPPRILDPLTTGRAATSLPVLQLLGKLGDLRALPILRKAINDVDPTVAAAGAEALARLGDDSAVPAARVWLSRLETPGAARESAARTLVIARAPDAPRAVAILLADPATRAAALDLALLAPTPQLSPSLAGFLSIASADERKPTLMALSRSGGLLAVRTLEPLVAALDTDAALALARCPSAAATDAVTRSLRNAGTRRLGARMGIARFASLGQAPDDLELTLRSMLRASEPADRETAAFGLALARWQSVPSLAALNDQGVTSAACRAALALDESDRAACAGLLAEQSPPVLRDAIAAVLFDPRTADFLSSKTLTQWSEAPHPSATVFARILASRDTDGDRPRLERFLASGDPVLRAQVALGLASSATASATSLLVEALALEEHPVVRRALVRALSHRNAVHHVPLLTSLSSLDPDSQTRNLAALAARGVRLPLAPTGSEVLWLQTRISPSSSHAARASIRAWLPSGFAFSTVSDSDGFAMIPGVVPGETTVTVGIEVP